MLDVNEYFDGKVKSISFSGSDLPATLGVMAPGEYTFSTSKREFLTVLDHQLKVKLPNESDWSVIESGNTFSVAANESFDLIVENETPYLCKYE